MLNNDHIKIIESHLRETLVNKNLNSINKYITDNALISTEFGRSVGIDTLKINFKNWFDIFSNITIDIEKTLLLSSDIAICEFNQSALHSGFFKGIPPKFRKVNFKTLLTCKFYENKIIDYNVSYDFISLINQIKESGDNLNDIVPRPILYGDNAIVRRIQEFPVTCHLTLRELECLAFWVNGKSAKTIAKILAISDRTVETHLRNISIKMSCNGKQHLINNLIRLGIKPLLDEHVNITMTTTTH